MTSYRGRLLSLGAIVGIFLLSTLVSEAAPADAASNGTWSIYPTTSPGTRAQVVFSPVLTPGGTVAASVTISNLSSSSLSFDLYSADAFNTPGGGLSLRRRVDPVEGMGAWIRLAHSAAAVPAHGSVAIPFVIAVPSSATPGDHVGGIVAEQTTGTPSSKGSVPINVIQAVGVRVYGRVKGPLVRRLTVRPPTLSVNTSASGLFLGTSGAAITIHVTNSGNVVLTPIAHLRVTSTFGSSFSRTFGLGPLLPGESVTVRRNVSIRSAGNLLAQVRVVADGAGSTAQTSQWILPWGALVLMVLVAGGLMLVLLFGARRLRTPPDRTDSVRDELRFPGGV
jgi:hypothetical protein